MPTDGERLAWCAGFVESEAFWYFSNGGVAMQLSIDKNFSRLTRFSAILGFRLGTADRQGRLKLSVEGRRLSRTMAALWPYLSIDTKREFSAFKAAARDRYDEVPDQNAIWG